MAGAALCRSVDVETQRLVSLASFVILEACALTCVPQCVLLRAPDTCAFLCVPSFVAFT